MLRLLAAALPHTPRRRHSFPAAKPERPGLGGSGSSSGTLAAAAASMALEEASALGAAGDEEDEEGLRPASMLSHFRALVLDSSYRPIDVVHWQRAILMDLLEKAGEGRVCLAGVYGRQAVFEEGRGRGGMTPPLPGPGWDSYVPGAAPETGGGLPCVAAGRRCVPPCPSSWPR